MPDPENRVDHPEGDQVDDQKPTEQVTVEGESIELDDVSIGELFGDDGIPKVPEAKPKEEAAEETEEETPTEPEPIDPPQHWADGDKEAFKALPRDRQEWVLKRDKEMTADYTRKTQELAERGRMVEGLVPLGQALQSDPGFREYIKNYQPGKPAQAPSGDEQPPDDPIERIKWEAKREAIQEFEQRFEARRQQETIQGHQRAIAETMAEHRQDEHYQTVQESLFQWVKSLDPELRQDAFIRLDRDPKFYRRKYAEVRERIVKPAAPEPTPKPRKETVHAPNLRPAGADTGETAEMTRRQKLRNIRSRMDKGDVQAIGEWFDAIGQ